MTDRRLPPRPGRRPDPWWHRAARPALLALVLAGPSFADEPPAPEPAGPTSPRTFEVSEYRVEGCEQLSEDELEAVLAPYLGPGQVLESIERARAAVERAYSDKGFQSVSVAIPRQTVRDGVVTLRAAEGRVGRLRVRGARWFSPRDVRLQAPSVAEGRVPNFNDLVRDVVALNQLPDRRVTPALRAGVEPGTVDVDLNVIDDLPLHGSLELNNRQSPNTTALRISGGLRYDNLWQLGHSLGLSFQVAPQRPKDAEVFGASYLARWPGLAGVTVGLNGLLQRSDLSTLGSVGVRGRGWVLGGRATAPLPAGGDFFHAVSAGLDFKRFDEGLSLGSDTVRTPIRYVPLTVQYTASWSGPPGQTALSVSLIHGLRPLGSGTAAFDAKRYRATGDFVYGRAELSRTQELEELGQLYGRMQGQYSREPLLGSEQLAAGGAESVRGYPEVLASGDMGAVGTLEVRSPSLSRWVGRPALTEGRLAAFLDAGWLGLHDTLAQQRSAYRLVGTGLGLRARLFDHLAGAAEVGLPLATSGAVRRLHPRLHLKLSGEF